MDRCRSCGERSVIVDLSTNNRVCSSCGVEHSSDNFQSQAFTSDGRPTGYFVNSVGDFTYREAKIYRAQTLITELTSRLGFSAERSDDVSRMVSKLTDGEFGSGQWFPVLIVACAYITMRQNCLPFPIAEAAVAVGREVHEVGRMAARVARFLNLDPLPEFDIFQSLERTVRTSPIFAGVEKRKAEEMVRQGRFLLQCTVKWFLTTGRQPLPVVAAVVAFIAEVNGLAAGVEEIARDIYAGVATSKLRKKELVDTLIKASKRLLPWGEDVTVKNIVQNAPLLLRFMEVKSKSGSLDLLSFGLDSKVLGNGYLYAEGSDSSYFGGGGDQESNQDMSCDDGLKRLNLSGECLSNAYKKALHGLDIAKCSGNFGKSHERKRKKDVFEVGMDDVFEVGMDRRWKKNKLTLDEILERDVGFDSSPPSFTAGLEKRKRRREKIDAAKRRIDQIKNPPLKEDCSPLGTLKARDQLGEELGNRGIDWEDCIVEKLLLHCANEEEIEQGHYKRLMDLHVFSGI